MLSYQEIRDELDKLQLMLVWAIAIKDFDSQFRYSNAMKHLTYTIAEMYSPEKAAA